MNDICDQQRPAENEVAAHQLPVRNFIPGVNESALKRYHRTIRCHPNRDTMDYLYLGERGRRQFPGYRPGVWELMLPPFHPDHRDDPLTNHGPYRKER